MIKLISLETPNGGAAKKNLSGLPDFSHTPREEKKKKLWTCWLLGRSLLNLVSLPPTFFFSFDLTSISFHYFFHLLLVVTDSDLGLVFQIVHSLL